MSEFDFLLVNSINYDLSCFVLELLHHIGQNITLTGGAPI